MWFIRAIQHAYGSHPLNSHSLEKSFWAPAKCLGWARCSHCLYLALLGCLPGTVVEAEAQGGERMPPEPRIPAPPASQARGSQGLGILVLWPLLGYMWRIVNFIYLKCVICYILTHVYTCEIISTVKIVNTPKPVTLKTFSSFFLEFCPFYSFPPATQVLLISFHSWLVFLFVRFLYEWNHTVCILWGWGGKSGFFHSVWLTLGYFCIHCLFILFCYYYYVDLPQLFNPFTCECIFGLFQLEAVTNKAAMNIHVQVFVWSIRWFLLGINTLE